MVIMQNGDQIAGGGLPVIHITQAQYDANPSAYADPNVLVHITDAPRSHLQASDVEYDSNMGVDNIGNIATNSLGKVEYKSDNVALYAHAVGEYFINKDGEYCVCTSAISVGQTLTKNTNYTVTDIASEIKEINSNVSPIIQSYTPTILGGDATFANLNFYYIKINKMVIVTGRFQITSAGSQAGSIEISLPNLMTHEYTGVGNMGSLSKAGYCIRLDNAGSEKILITAPAGNPSLPSIGAGWFEIMAIAILQ